MSESRDAIRPLSVRILEKEYIVACSPDERTDLLDSAEILNKSMREIRDSGKISGLDRIAVMASGRLSAARPARESDAETIGQMMSGSFIGTDEAQAGSRVFANAVAPPTIDAP